MEYHVTVAETKETDFNTFKDAIKNLFSRIKYMLESKKMVSKELNEYCWIEREDPAEGIKKQRAYYDDIKRLAQEFHYSFEDTSVFDKEIDEFPEYMTSLFFALSSEGKMDFFIDNPFKEWLRLKE